VPYRYARAGAGTELKIFPDVVVICCFLASAASAFLAVSLSYRERVEREFFRLVGTGSIFLSQVQTTQAVSIADPAFHQDRLPSTFIGVTVSHCSPIRSFIDTTLSET
jgi:hypothetical protein